MLRQASAFVIAFGSALTLHADIRCGDVLNSASFQSRTRSDAQFATNGVYRGVPSGGALATVFCTGTDTNPGTYLASTAEALPFRLANVMISVNGAAAPLLSVYVPPDAAYTQINFQMPTERNASSYLGTSEGYVENPVRFRIGLLTFEAVGQRGIGGFFADENGYAIAKHDIDGSPITLQNPARPGETIIVYGDDFFPVWPPPPIGRKVGQESSYERNPGTTESNFRFYGSHLYLQEYPQYREKTLPNASYGSFTTTPELKITFAGLAPGMIGVEQINFVVPANQAPGDWALFFNEGSCPDPSNCPARVREGISSAYVKLPVR